MKAAAVRILFVLLATIVHINHSAGESFSIKSAVLKEDIEIWVNLPERYDRTASSFQSIYVLDADGLFRIATEIGNYLSNDYVDYMPQLVTVGVRSKDGQWRRKYFGAGTASPDFIAFTKFLRDELIPFIEKKYRVDGFRILSGHSLAGLFASRVLTTNADLFNAYLAMSPSLPYAGQTTITDFKKLSLNRPTFLQLSVGDHDLPRYERFIRLFNDSLSTFNKPNLKTDFRPYAERDHHTVGPTALYGSLLRLFNGWNLFDSVAPITSVRVTDHYKSLSNYYGHTFSDEFKLIWLGQNLYNVGSAESAKKVFTQVVEKFPTSPLGYFHLSRIYFAEARKQEALSTCEKSIRLMKDLKSPDLKKATALLTLIKQMPNE